MEFKTKDIAKYLHNSHYYPVYGLIGIIILLLGISIFVGYKVYDQYLLKQTLDIDYENGQESVRLIRSTQTQLAPKIDEYNAVLERLIPDQESYFKVISALEELSSKTGVQIISYSIDLQTTTEEKLSLSIEVNGDQQSIEKLLRDYTFSSGRLLTNEKVTFGKDEENVLTFTLNFYHKEFDGTIDTSTQQLQQKDIQYIEDIMIKLN